VYVGDLDLSVTKQMVIDHFKKKYHSVIDAKIITDQTTNLSKGYGFVMFSSKEDSNKALTEMQGSYLKGKPIKVSEGKSKGNQNNNQHGKGNSNNPNAQSINQMYTGGFYPGQTAPPGSMLGGLGVQFKPEALGQPMYGLQPQPYGYMPQGQVSSI
jgi:RNA recognition motif-containing protein